MDGVNREAALLKLRALVDECLADPGIEADVQIERGLDLTVDAFEPRPHENGTVTGTLRIRGGAQGTLWPQGSAVRSGK